MREIIFRGKQKNSGEWVYGSLIHCDLTDGRSYTCILESDEANVHPMDFPYLCCESGCIDGFANPVNPETVGQFTGLTDKNGNKIFEGDIIRTSNGRQSAVSAVKHGNFRPKMIYHMFWNYIGHEPKPDLHGVFCESTKEQMMLFDSPTCIEVIGNIHDNPELLEG